MNEFPKKLRKNLPENYEEAAQSFSSQDIKDRILDSEKKIMVIEAEKEADTALASAKEKLKDLNGAYRDATVCEKTKIKFLMHIRADRGEIDIGIS